MPAAHRTRRVVILCLILFSTARIQAAEGVSPFEWPDVERIVAIGDVHGSYDKLLPLLEGTGLVNGDLAWVGGASHLVFLGDLTDRGPNERPVLDLVRRLEAEAEAAGGRVHVLLGNHEVLNLVGDLRYVEGRGFADFTAEELPSDRNAARRRFQGIARKSGASIAEINAAFEERYPKGFFGRLRAFSRQGDYGEWLLSKPAVVKINDYLFLHGGLTAQVAGLGLGGINRGVHQSVNEYLDNRAVILDGEEVATYEETWSAAEALATARSARRKSPEKVTAAEALMNHFDGLAFSPSGPLWYRGNSVENEQIERAAIEQVLDSLDARGVAVAHTPTGTGRINSRLNGRIVRTDVGMAYGREPLCVVFDKGRIEAYDPAVRAAAPLIQEPPQGERWSDIQEQLPDAQLERYLQRAAVVDRLHVERGERQAEVWSLEHQGLELRGVFHFVDDPPGEDPNAAVRRYAHELAAYKLDRLMHLDLVPVTVFRQLDGRAGSLQVWMQAAIDKAQLEDYGRMDLLEGLENEIMRARIFNALIGGIERADYGKMLLPRERRILLADNTKAFPLSADLESLLPEGCTVAADFGLELRELDRSTLKESIGGHLSDGQIDALLLRRDGILAACVQQ